MPRFLFWICFLMPLLPLVAQEYSIIDRRAIKSYEDGEQFSSRRQWPEAMGSYRAAYERSHDFFEAYLRHAQVLLTTGNPSEALQVAERGERRIKDQNLFKGRFGWLISQLLVEVGEFESAIAKLRTIEEFLEEEFLQSENYLELKKRMDFIAFEITNQRDIIKEKLPEPLNTFQLQYFPVLTADSKKILFTKRDGLKNFEHEDIFVSYLEDDQWTEPQPISQTINTTYNEGTCTISADGNILIFTSCDTPDSFGSCDLYITQKVSDKWQRASNMGKNVNSRFWDSQPSLSADGRVLFFSSNRREGYGGNDIWFSERNEDGSWSEAKNLGPHVNTSRDEVSPFIFFNNEVLFFASDGHLGFGGKDLFMSTFSMGEFGPPVNLGYPINDQKDQLALFITAQKDYAYYTENSYQDGKADSSFLYRFNFPKEIDLGEKIIVSEGRVLDRKTGEPIDARLSLVNLANDSTMYEFLSDGKTGEFVMLYPDKSLTGLYVEKKGFIPKIYNVDRDSLKNRSNIQIELDPIERGKNFVFENVYFDTDKSELKEASVSSLNRLSNFLRQHPQVNIQVEGHTDNVGVTDYNLALSLRRAQSVKEYLVDLGIPSERMETLGKGDSEPIKPNDSEENRSFNRRIEVIIQ
ncbi:OmpA family protein [Lunatibacter salilacus]|uniref:OmpA family protein n=1 Tax=Lunatibacter salilacus TaxID=2483804 RepID=UPI00131B79C8|nr:OmpA family protein [Lunatibacter salilacus]